MKLQENTDEKIITEETEDITNKKCPNCGATITFDPKTGKLHCVYCGYKGELPKPEQGNQIIEHDFESATKTKSFRWGAQKKNIECKQCGAVTTYDALETAAICPFCGSTNVMPAAVQDSIAPDAICLFTITKEKAGESFTKWMKKKWFTPRKAKKNAKPEAFKGVYLPYWTYDTQTTSNFTGEAGYNRTVKKKDGSTETVTDWKSVRGVYQEYFDDETVMASKHHENSGVTKCEPFNLSKMVTYTPQAVAGFAAERYSIGLKEGWTIAQEKIQETLDSNIHSYIRSNWNSDDVRNVRFSTLYSNITYKYLLVPVWISSFMFKNKKYQFVVNGQTGKVGGKAPISAFRVIIAILLATAAFVGIYYAIQ